MEKFKLDQDIKVFCEPAKSFPDKVLEAHQKLHSLIPFTNERRYFGLSRPNEQGIIEYKAAAEEMSSGEGEKLGCEAITIKSGNYQSIIIKDYMKDIPSIGKAFQMLIALPDIDPEGYCVEWYLNDKDVKCMVRLRR